MHFPLSLVNAIFTHISGLPSSFTQVLRTKRLFLRLFLALVIMALTASPALAGGTWSVTNENLGGVSPYPDCSGGVAGVTFDNGDLQGAIDCAVTSSGTDTIIIKGGANVATFINAGNTSFNRPEPYVGAFGVPWTETGNGGNGLVIIEGRNTDWTPVTAIVDYSSMYSVGWWDTNAPVRLENFARDHYSGMPLIANMAVGFTVTGSNVTYGVPVSIANIQFEGENIALFIKGDSDEAQNFNPNGAGTTVTNTRVYGYGCGTSLCNDTKYGHGIALYGGTKASITNNEISSNYDGIAIADKNTAPVLLGNYLLFNKRNGVGVRNDAAPLVGPKDKLGRRSGALNLMLCNYIGVGIRDNSIPTIANNVIYGKMLYPATQLQDYDQSPQQDQPFYNKLGIAARDYSAPVIYGNAILYNRWGGIVNMDFTTPEIGHEDWGNPKVRNFLQNNSRDFTFNTTGKCNIRAEVEGRAAIGSKDAAKPIIMHNVLSQNNWAGIGNKDWAAAYIVNNNITNTPTGIVLSNTMTTEPGDTDIFSNNVKRCSNVGIAVRDSGNATYRVLIHNNMIRGHKSYPSSGIGLNHSYASIYNNTIYEAGTNVGGSLIQKSSGIGMRNGANAIITGNRVMGNGIGITVLGSRVIVENNLITDNWGVAEALGVWITDQSIADRINHNVIVGNQLTNNKFKGTGILIKNDSVVREAKYNIIHNFMYGVKANAVSGGSIEEGGVDYNLVTREVYGASDTFTTDSQEESDYELYYYDSTIGSYIQDYPGPHTQYFGSRSGGNLEPNFVNPGTSSNTTRNFSLNTSGSFYNIANSNVYSLGVYSDFALALDFSDMNNKSFNNVLPSSFYADTTSPTFTNNTDIRMVKSTPEPGSTNTHTTSNGDIVVYLRDTGEGIDGSSISVTVTDDSAGVGSASITYEPDRAAIPISSWYKVTFSPDRDLDGNVTVTTSADDAAGTPNSLSDNYSFQASTIDGNAPFLNSLYPPSNIYSASFRADKRPQIRFHMLDTDDGTSSGNPHGGIDPSTISVSVQATPAGSASATTTALTTSDVVQNTDPTDTIITYTPSADYEYDSTVTVTVSADDFAGNSTTQNYSFTIMTDDFAPESAQAFHGDPAGTNGVFLTWLRSVDSEGDMANQVIYYCDNWNASENRHECYGKGGTNAWNWQYWNGIGSVVDSTMVDDLPEGRYLFMLEVEDERGTSTHPDKTEDFSTSAILTDGTWSYGESVYYQRGGGDAFEVDAANNLLKAYASTDSGSSGDAQLMLADYYPGNFYLRYRFNIVGNYHGAYVVLRHNVGEMNSMGGLLGTSGYLAYVTSSKMGFKIMPDPITLESGCDLCNTNSDLLTPASVTVGVGSNDWHEVRIAAYDGQIRMELWDLTTPSDKASAVSGDTPQASITTQDAYRYLVGEVGFYVAGKEVASTENSVCTNFPPASHIEYADLEIEWYGILSDDYVYVRGGYFNDDFTGFEDDFSGDLTAWTINGNASWDVASAELVSDGVNGELISFGFVPQKDFKASVQVSVDNSNDPSYFIFRRQYRNAIGETGYLATIEDNGTNSELGFYKITSSGLQEIGTWAAGITNSDTYTMQIDVSDDTLNLTVFNNGTTSLGTVTATDTTYTGGMVGIYRGDGSSSAMEYDNFQLNDQLTNDWITTSAVFPSWDVSLTDSTPSGSFAMEAINGTGDSEALVKDLIINDSFMFEGDMYLSDTDTNNKGVAFYFQKQLGSIEGKDAYGLMLKINTSATGNVYFFKLDDVGTMTTLLNGSSGNAELGGYDIGSDEIVHVKIVGSGANIPDAGSGGYGFAAYLSKTAAKPYVYTYVTGAQATGLVSSLYTDGQAGFFLPGGAFFESPASIVNIDNVVIGRMEDFAIPYSGAGGTATNVIVYDNVTENYASIQNAINNISSAVAGGDDCGDQYIKLGAGIYSIGNNVLDMGECVAIRGVGDSTIISGTGSIVISFSQNSHKSSLEDLTVSGSDSASNDACIWIIDDSPFIKDVQVRDCWDGIRIGGGLHDPEGHPARPTITASRIIYNTHVGIGNNVASDAWIVDNRIYANGYNGIGVLDMAAPRIENNIIGSAGDESIGWVEGNGNMGIGVWDNSSPAITGNSISVNNIGGIGVRGNSTPDIVNNIIASNEYGIMAYEWAEPLIYYNIMRNNSSFGNAAQDSVIWEVRYNEIHHNDAGIAMMEDSTGLIEGNYVYSNSKSAPYFTDAGIRVRGGVDTSIYNNWVVDNEYKGIAFMDTPATANILIRYNYIAGNSSQSATTGNFGISIAGNNLYSNYGSVNNGNFVIDKNVIRKNKDGGVGFTYFGGTLLFEENIVASNTATHTTAGGISFFTTTNADININNNTFYSNQGAHAGGIGFSLNNSGTTVSVTNNDVYWNNATATDYANGGIGFLDSLGEIHISGNTIHSNTSNATCAGIGLRWINLTGSVADPIRLLNNTIYSHRDSNAILAGSGPDTAGLLGKAGIGVRNITFDNTAGILISGNTINNNSTGIRVRGDNPAAGATGPVSITNNVINSSRLNGILVQGNGIQYPTNIIGNELDNSGIVSDGGRAGIRVREIDADAMVRNNSVLNFGKSGIRSRSIMNTRTTYIESNVLGSISGTGIGITTMLSGSSASISNNLVYSTTNPNVSHGSDPDDGGMSLSTFSNNIDAWIYSNELRNNGSDTGIGGIGFYSEIYSATASGVKITMDNNIIWNNIGESGGGVGFTNINATVTIINNSVHNNASTSTNKGVGGIGFMESGGSVFIDNNVIYNNVTSNTQPD